jgi:biofilm PGA synthesis N-glycosyltransferase PgaC
MSDAKLYRYILISPVKDEEKYVEATLRSIAAQTLRPYRWIILDDGSRDATPEFLRQYAARYDWIQVVRIDRDASRLPGAAEIRAFARGYEMIAAEDFDFVVKLDCDLDLPPDYFENLCQRFHDDPSLGLASGVYLEQKNGEWTPIEMPDYHAAGASKMYRKKCYTDIGGLVFSRAWDSLDEIRALNMGWKTRHFADLQFHHLKKEGSGIGSIRTNVMHGEIYYLTGGGRLFFLFKVLDRMLRGNPFLIAGSAMLWGYLECWIAHKPRLVRESEAQCYRQMLNSRIRNAVSSRFRRTMHQREA